MTEKTSGARKATGLLVAAGVGLVALGVVAWFFLTQEKPTSAQEAQSPAQDTTKLDITTEPEEQAAAPDASHNTDKQQSPAASSGFDVVRVEPDGSAVVAGHARPGSTIQLTLNGDTLEDVAVGADGNFVALLDLPVETPGALGFQTLDDGGQVTGATPQTVLIAPVTTPPMATDAASSEVEAPTSSPDDEAAPTGAAPQVVLADEGGVSVMQDGSGSPKVDNIVIDAITYDDAGDVALSGRAQSGADLRVYLDNKPISAGEVTVGGQWRVPLPKVDGGVYTLRVDELAPDGTVTSRVETPFKREEPAQLAAVANAGSAAPKARAEAVTVQPGSTLWAIAREHLGEGPLYVRVFAANREQIRDPDLIYPGQVFAIPGEE
ncbi:LysM peptidoglycan-binding domain-containing protein [uncultured Aliiroseovarius sp.]|uniref:LysM peptidoglycan-binding domain-containing protein n=1 Tax=uncultured Aliiroseovarius sp. TaxID=1658783 RepID=UPI0025914389|nr:LysM peptidoglycan-binding domain-containing protein [uncultured Aliiroseovarius sp.]